MASEGQPPMTARLSHYQMLSQIRVAFPQYFNVACYYHKLCPADPQSFEQLHACLHYNPEKVKREKAEWDREHGKFQ